jgi:hypothetical protein
MNDNEIPDGHVVVRVPFALIQQWVQQGHSIRAYCARGLSPDARLINVRVLAFHGYVDFAFFDPAHPDGGFFDVVYEDLLP